MNLGLRALLLIAAVACFIITVFSSRHWHDWMAIGLAFTAGSFLVADLGWDRPLGRTRRT